MQLFIADAKKSFQKDLNYFFAYENMKNRAQKLFMIYIHSFFF